MSSTLSRPGYDPELEAILSKLGFTPTVTAADIDRVRALSSPSLSDAIAGRAIKHEQRVIKGDGGDLVLSIFQQNPRLEGSSTELPYSCQQGRLGIYYVHGGGMMAGNRFLGIRGILDWVVEENAVYVSVEYRLPPEHPDPAPVEDSYTGLLWVNQHAADLGIDPDRLIIAGSSAGGGIAAGTALLARDRGTVALLAQMLICPMLDDRDSSISSQQYVEEGTWSRGSNVTGWTCLLGERRGGDQVSIYAAPSRATELKGLPPAFIEVGSAEVFRDEAVSYATLLWASGVQAELHVWPGGFHGFNLLAPNATLSVDANAAQSSWLRRILAEASTSQIAVDVSLTTRLASRSRC